MGLLTPLTYAQKQRPHTRTILLQPLLPLLFLFLCVASLACAQTFYILDIHPNSDVDTTDELTSSIAHREGFYAAIHALKDNTGNSALAPRIELVTVDDPDRLLSLEETVQSALDTWPDLLAIFGPFNIDAALELRDSSILADNNLMCLGLASNSQQLRTWTPHFYFFRAEPVTEVTAMVTYGVKTLTARRFGFMFIENTSFGLDHLETLYEELARTPITEDEVIVYRGLDVEGSVNEDALEQFLSGRPQLIMLYGRAGPHTSDFVFRVLTDPRTRDAKLLVPSTSTATAFDGIEKALKSGASTIADKQVLVFTTNHLGIETQYAHIRYFQTQMRQYILDGLSSAYSADDPDAFLTDDSRREMNVAGWIAGSAAIKALRDPTWWNLDAVDGYNTVGATPRERFMNYLFLPARSYTVGEDFFIGQFGGACDASHSQVPEMGLACECNQGGRTAFVNKLIVTNMSLVPAPEYHFTYSKAYCYVRDAYVLPRPLGVLLVTEDGFLTSTTTATNTTKSSVSTSSDSISALDNASAALEAFRDDLDASFASAAVYLNSQHTDNTLSIENLHTAASESAALMSSFFADHLLMSIAGTVHAETHVGGALVINPFYTTSAVPNTFDRHKVFLFPTFEQQMFVAYQYLTRADSDLTGAQKRAHFILRTVNPDDTSAITDILKKTTATFNYPDSIMTSATSVTDSLSAALSAETPTRKVMLGLKSGDAAEIVAYLRNTTGVTVLLLFDDVLMWYTELHAAFSTSPASVRRRVFFETNLPIWTDTSAAHRQSFPLLAAYQDSLAEGSEPTPLGFASWVILAFNAEITTQVSGVITSASLVDAVYKTQAFRVYALSFQNFQLCANDGGDAGSDDSLEVSGSHATKRTRGATLTTLARIADSDSSIAAHETSNAEIAEIDGSDSGTVYVNDTDTCESRNFGAIAISVYTFEAIFSPDTHGAAYGPVTPSMIYTVTPAASSLSNGAIAGIVVGAVMAVAIVVALVVVLCCLCRGGARDNKNAPKELQQPVTLIFTDIESSTALWASDPEEMPDAVAAHHKLIRGLIADYDCYEVKTIGDSFMIACKDPFAAVQLASDIQTTFLEHDWRTTAIDDCYHNFEFAKEKSSAEERARTPRSRAKHQAEHGNTAQNDNNSNNNHEETNGKDSATANDKKNNNNTNADNNDNDGADASPTAKEHVTFADVPDSDEPPLYVSPSAHLPNDVYKRLWHGLRVRAGIHTGLSDIRYDEITGGFDYYGETSNMAARTEAVGNGGQIVLTESAWWALSQDERDSLRCTPLGPQCLRGVPFEVGMYQVDAVPGRAFAPLRVEIEAQLPPGADADDDEDAEEACALAAVAEETDETGAPVSTTKRALGSCGSDIAAGTATSELTASTTRRTQGALKLVAMFLNVVFRPFRGDDKVECVRPLLEKWGVSAPARPKSVTAENYAQTLLHSLAVKLASVTAASQRLREERLESLVDTREWEDLAQSRLNATGTWPLGGFPEATGAASSAVRRDRIQESARWSGSRRMQSQAAASTSAPFGSPLLSSVELLTSSRRTNPGRSPAFTAIEEGSSSPLSIFHTPRGAGGDGSGGRAETEVAREGTCDAVAQAFIQALPMASTNDSPLRADRDEVSMVRRDRSPQPPPQPPQQQQHFLRSSPRGLMPKDPPTSTGNVFVLPSGNRSDGAKGLTSGAIAMIPTAMEGTAEGVCPSYSQLVLDLTVVNDSSTDVQVMPPPNLECAAGSSSFPFGHFPAPPISLGAAAAHTNAALQAATYAAATAAATAAAGRRETGASADGRIYEGSAADVAGTMTTMTMTTATAATSVSQMSACSAAHLVVDSPLHFSIIADPDFEMEGYDAPANAAGSAKLAMGGGAKAAAPISAPVSRVASLTNRTSTNASAVDIEAGGLAVRRGTSAGARSTPSLSQPTASGGRPIFNNPLAPDLH